MADPDVPRQLSEAITLVGTCQDMCPEYERVTRMVQNDVWRAEYVSYTWTRQSTSKLISNIYAEC
jgi:hypothetical protein